MRLGVLDGVVVKLGAGVEDVVRLAVLLGVRVWVAVGVSLGGIGVEDGKPRSVEVGAGPLRKMGSMANTPKAMMAPTMATTAKAMRRSRQRGVDSSIRDIIDIRSGKSERQK